MAKACVINSRCRSRIVVSLRLSSPHVDNCEAGRNAVQRSQYGRFVQSIVGIMGPGEPSNIAEHKDEYIADAIQDWN